MSSLVLASTYSASTGSQMEEQLEWLTGANTTGHGCATLATLDVDSLTPAPFSARFPRSNTCTRCLWLISVLMVRSVPVSFQFHARKPMLT